MESLCVWARAVFFYLSVLADYGCMNLASPRILSMAVKYCMLEKLSLSRGDSILLLLLPDLAKLRSSGVQLDPAGSKEWSECCAMPKPSTCSGPTQQWHSCPDLFQQWIRLHLNGVDKERNIGKWRLEITCHLPIPEPGPCNKVHLPCVSACFLTDHQKGRSLWPEGRSLRTRGEEPRTWRGGGAVRTDLCG